MNAKIEKYNYCTLFDYNYLHKGLALYFSLEKYCESFHLYVLAFDDKCHSILCSLNLEHITVVSLAEFETEELLNIKPTRNRAEYCWTSGPSAIYHFITNYHLDHCTYLDADMMFFSSPKPIYQEIGESSTALTEHFTQKVDVLGGRFCVQFVYFKNDIDGMKSLTWWKDKCIEWCYARYEDGKFGDQKYLDYFEEKFKNVCILKNRGAGVAPWNAKQYEFSEFGKLHFEKNIIDIIFFHYHGTRIEPVGNELVLKTLTYDLETDLKEQIYIPYLELLVYVYNTYLNNKLKGYRIESRSLHKIFFSKIKFISRTNKLAQYIYFDIFKVKYNGYEGNK